MYAIRVNEISKLAVSVLAFK